MRIAAGIVLAMAAISALSHASTASAKESFSFTQAQASAGREVFEARCSACHGTKLQGIVAPALAGPHSAVKAKTAATLFAFITKNMPLSAPGSLSRDQYLRITAFLLQANGHRAGSVPLTYDVVRHSGERV